jgi:crotonobetaine/carnitine-CoA ligase
MSSQTHFFSDRDCIPALLEQCAAERPAHVYCTVDGQAITHATLHERVARAAAALYARGVRPGDRVAVMLGHHFDHVIAFFALMRVGAVLVPVNIHLRGAGLAHVLSHSEPSLLLADAQFREVLREIPFAQSPETVVWRETAAEFTTRMARASGLHENRAPFGSHHSRRTAADSNLADLFASESPPLPPITLADSDVRGILYTSGTTGAAKGVVMTDRMYRAAALGSMWIGDIGPGSVLHFWDPIYHVFGSEVLVLALMVPVTLAMVPRFSASQLWDEARRAGATHLHFVGGVLQLLLKQPPSPRDRDHPVRIAWGGGCPQDVWRPFEERFGVRIREGYGMTETSSFSVINREGRLGSIGTAVPYFDVQVVDHAGREAVPRAQGEIRVAEREHGTMFREYFRNPEATAATIRDAWLYTGDLGWRDEDGFLYFSGRKKDSLRRRGENVSAWEVERVVNEHPQVEECALVGVVNEFGDEDLKLFVKSRAAKLDPAELVAWCTPRLAAFQVPRFIAFVEGFAKTPTQRIQKQFLSRALDDCWDSEKTRTKA